ncbi:hypothetical protein G6F36_016170 [Rhizopus arrhizus]|nr:hypothetical protein G6F36_016170 [Rhizopus arrhizus]
MAFSCSGFSCRNRLIVGECFSSTFDSFSPSRKSPSICSSLAASCRLSSSRAASGFICDCQRASFSVASSPK